MTAVAFKKVRQFHADIDELKRAVNQFEQNADDAFALVGMLFVPRLKTTERKTSNVQVQFGQLVPIDSASGNISVLLPAPSQQQAGLGVGLARLSASNTITVITPSGVINSGTASATLASTLKLYLLYADGANWWTL